MKQRILEDVAIECEVPSHIGWHGDPEQRAKRIESWIRGFEAFIRDHRSQDPVALHVNRRYAEVCSHCFQHWEEDEEGPLCCPKAQEEHAAQQVLEAA